MWEKLCPIETNSSEFEFDGAVIAGKIVGKDNSHGFDANN